MSENYGKRSDDLMLQDLPPEVAARLTDTQKINIKILQNLTSINTALNDVKHDVNVHQKLLVTGNGDPSILERLRKIEDFVANFRYWSRYIGSAFILQAITLAIGLAIVVVRLQPLLEKIANQP